MPPSSSVKLSSPGSSDVDLAPAKIVDEKKRRRMISNRESARRSRMRRQKHMEDLLTEKAALEKKIEVDDQKYIALCENHQVIESENKGLRSEKMKLCEYLRYLDQIVENCEGMEPNIGVQISKAWHVNGAAKSITASGALDIQYD